MVFIKVSIVFIVTVGTDISSNFTLFLKIYNIKKAAKK
jgi:hypothetical protein